MTFEQKLKEVNGYLRKCSLPRGMTQRNDMVSRAHLVCSRHRKEKSMAKAEWARWK
jgi:hypothetical protein